MILVSGASGNVGSEVAGALAAGGHPVRALVRDPAKAPGGTEPLVGDLTAPEELDFTGCSALFLMPGYPGVAAAAARAGLGRVVLMSGSSAETGDRSNAVTKYMLESEDEVRGAVGEWTILRPSAFMTNATRWLPQLAEGDEIRAQFPRVAASLIDPADIGAVAAAALTGDGHAGRVYRITGPEALTPEQQVRILAEATGRPLRFAGLTDEQTRAELAATMPQAYVDAFWNFYVEGALDESVVTDTVSTVAGRPPRTFAQWAAGHSELFR